MTDELKDHGEGSFITEFVSGGPKHYAYKVLSSKEQKEKVYIKVKGFAINCANSAAINFESLRKKVFAFIKEKDRQETEIRIRRIERQMDRKVVSITRKKIYRITYDKRVVGDDFTTTPYGFRA